MAPIGTTASNNTTQQNSFLQNKYQFATYYGQKTSSYPSPGPHQPSGVISGGQAAIMASGKYEYNIEGGVTNSNPIGTPSQS
jgi:hypothetical protein